jgi:hypothetical protein
MDQPGLGGRTTHVERNDPRFVQPACQRRTPDNTSRWTGLDDVRRRIRRESRRSQPAVGLHQLQRRLDSQFAQSRIQRADVGSHHRLHIGVDDGGAGARILLDLRQYLTADGHRYARQRSTHLIGDRPLMRRIGIAVQQANRHTGYVLGS